MNDAALLAAVPEFLSVGGMLKALPATEGDKRILYLEASNEKLDYQKERIAAKALADSTDYYLRYGNVDIDHVTMLGAKLGIPDYNNFEIGRPVDVRQRDGLTFVKAEIASGVGPVAQRANDFWSSLVDKTPPTRWYPSVAGAIIDKSVEVDPETLERRAIIKKVRWSSIGMSRTPVNLLVPTCATVPMGAFAKSWMGSGFDFAKAIEAGYGTDSAELTDGAALRKQSLDGAPVNYFDFRNKLAKAMRDGKVGANPCAADLAKYTRENFGLSADGAAEHVERFMRDLSASLSKRRTQ